MIKKCVIPECLSPGSRTSRRKVDDLDSGLRRKDGAFIITTQSRRPGRRELRPLKLSLEFRIFQLNKRRPSVRAGEGSFNLK